jgi:hypothetical protein
LAGLSENGYQAVICVGTYGSGYMTFNATKNTHQKTSKAGIFVFPAALKIPTKVHRKTGILLFFTASVHAVIGILVL